MAAAVLLSTTLKFEGKLILQARSEGQIPLLMVECTNALEIRAIARGAEQATSTNFDQLLSNGQLVITIDPDQGQRYQGIVPLIGDSLAHSLDSLLRAFRAVENARVACRRRAARSGTAAATTTAATDRRYAERSQQWAHASSLADTVQDDELLASTDPDTTVPPVSRGTGAPVRTCCGVISLQLLTATHLQCPGLAGARRSGGFTAGIGRITMDCEFCNQQYHFSREDLGEVLGEPGARTLH